MSFVTEKSLKVALEGVKSELDNNLPKKVSQLENDSEYITSTDTYNREQIGWLLDSTNDTIESNKQEVYNKLTPIFEDIYRIIGIDDEGNSGTNTKLKEEILEAIAEILDGKVDKVENKQLSTNDYTNEDKNKLTALPTYEELNDQFQVINSDLDNKVDKVAGKQLSTEDFTSEFKTKLDSLENYDDNDIKESISEVSNRLNYLVENDKVDDVIDTFTEIETFLEDVANSETLVGMLQKLKESILEEVPKLWSGTIDEYKDIKEKDNNTLYLIPVI